MEARLHMVYFVLNSFGMLLAVPLIINGLLLVFSNLTLNESIRWTYYQKNIGKIMPSLFYIATKKNEDCFKCFNRLAP